MKIETIIRILDNKEYRKITRGCMYVFKWFDIELYNGDMIRVEQVTMNDEIPNKYRISYFTFELDDGIEYWVGEYRTNAYYMFSNLFNEVEQDYKKNEKLNFKVVTNRQLKHMIK